MHCTFCMEAEILPQSSLDCTLVNCLLWRALQLNRIVKTFATVIILIVSRYMLGLISQYQTSC